MSNIVKLLKYPTATVYRVYNAWKAEGKAKRKKHEPWRDRKVTPRVLAGP